MPGKDDDPKKPGWEFINAVNFMDLDGAKRCLAINPDDIHSCDSSDNNAMHICVAGGAAIRSRELMLFLLEETKIDLLHQNCAGLDPLDLAFSLNDRSAIQLIEPFAHDQLNERYPLEPELSVISQPKKGPDFSPK